MEQAQVELFFHRAEYALVFHLHRLPGRASIFAGVPKSGFARKHVGRIEELSRPCQQSTVLGIAPPHICLCGLRRDRVDHFLARRCRADSTLVQQNSIIVSRRVLPAERHEYRHHRAGVDLDF